MKFDRNMLATMLAVSAAALAGCDQRQCVDAKGKVVPDSLCGHGTGAGAGGGVHPGFFFVPVMMRSPVGSTAAVARGGFGGECGGGHGGAGE